MNHDPFRDRWREGAKLENGDVGQDRGAAGGDAIFDEEAAELGEEVVDLDGRAKVCCDAVGGAWIGEIARAATANCMIEAK